MSVRSKIEVLLVGLNDYSHGKDVHSGLYLCEDESVAWMTSMVEEFLASFSDADIEVVEHMRLIVRMEGRVKDVGL